MTERTDHDLIVETHTKVSSIETFIQNFLDGKVGPCKEHAEAIRGLRVKVNWLWGLFGMLLLALLAAKVAL
jgi:hypothetical protein